MTFRFATLILVLALSACGFHLRGAMALPYNLDPVKVVSTDRYSPLALTLAEALTRAGATPATADTENPAVLELRPAAVHDVGLHGFAGGRRELLLDHVA